MNNETVLAFEVLCWNINSQSAIGFKSEILWFIFSSMIVTVNFIFRAKIVLDLELRISTKIDTCWDVSEQNWFSRLNYFALSFKSCVWFNTIDEPNSVSISSAGRHECNLLARDWCTNSRWVFHWNKTQLFSIEIFIGFDSYFLSISNILIASKDINLINSIKFEHRSGHWAWILSFASAGDGIAFINVWDSISNVHNNPTLCLLVLNHHAVIPFEISVVGVWPWHLLITGLIFWDSLCERKFSSLLFALIIVLLYSGQFKVFVPVTNSGFVVVLWSSL